MIAAAAGRPDQLVQARHHEFRSLFSRVCQPAPSDRGRSHTDRKAVRRAGDGLWSTRSPTWATVQRVVRTEEFSPKFSARLYTLLLASRLPGFAHRDHVGPETHRKPFVFLAGPGWFAISAVRIALLAAAPCRPLIASGEVDRLQVRGPDPLNLRADPPPVFGHAQQIESRWMLLTLCANSPTAPSAAANVSGE